MSFPFKIIMHFKNFEHFEQFPAILELLGMPRAGNNKDIEKTLQKNVSMWRTCREDDVGSPGEQNWIYSCFKTKNFI